LVFFASIRFFFGCGWWWNFSYANTPIKFIHMQLHIDVQLHIIEPTDFFSYAITHICAVDICVIALRYVISHVCNCAYEFCWGDDPGMPKACRTG
jgi:hypothetical protein